MIEAGAETIFLIAGEASGDLLGAHLMRALRQLRPGLRFAGVGGPRMVAEGIELFFPQQELAHFGLAELLVHIPHILRRVEETIAEVARRRPAALVTIDAPDFCFRVARQLKGRGIPLIHYVAPTVWAWRPKRAKKIAKFLDHLLALLPFELPYFTREGLGCSFVGHPILEGAARHGDGARYRTAHGVDPDAPLLCVLPGSRNNEITHLTPIFAATIARLAAAHPGLVCAVPTLPHLEARLRAATASWGVPVIVTSSDADKYDCFNAATVALACSGTVALELALAGLPAVIAYRINVMTAFLYRRLIKAKYANLVNIMHDRMVVPECLQDNCTVDNLARETGKLLADPAARAAQQAELRQTASWLGADDEAPSLRAARAVLAQLAADRT